MGMGNLGLLRGGILRRVSSKQKRGDALGEEGKGAKLAALHQMKKKKEERKGN